MNKKVAKSEKRVDEATEVLINVTMLSELLIDELEKLRSYPRFYRANVKVTGKQFNTALVKTMAEYYKDLGPEVSAHFTEQAQEFAHMFDFIKQMAVKDRMDLFDYLNTVYGEYEQASESS
jgi:hypothetical protein